MKLKGDNYYEKEKIDKETKIVNYKYNFSWMFTDDNL